MIAVPTIIRLRLPKALPLFRPMPYTRPITAMHRSPQAMLARPPPENITVNTPRDPNTLSNYHNFRTAHTTVEFRVDFEKKRLSGTVGLKLKSITDGETNEIVLDSREVDVKDVKVNSKSSEWEYGPEVPIYGRPLRIKLESGVPKDEMVSVDISVNTTEKCEALQWLHASQTSNGKHPYMFSQCEAINARSVFPCQDTPDIKSTFDFRLQSPLPVLVSGLPQGKEDVPGSDEKVYIFDQKVPIPSYLFAIASGDIVSADIGPRSTVWSGPEEIKDAKWELERDVEKYLQAAEKLVYPYVWGTYNVLILPPSFPFGGMENPMYTFATPTLLSGDRQNVDVIAHEACHSWSGNLVTTASFEHFWLNEGWTTYLERRLQQAVHGEKFRDFSAIIGWKALEDAVRTFGPDHEFTKLVPSLKGKDPEEAFSTVPYEKGFTFLYYIERLIGKAEFDRFIPHYFTVWKDRSLDSYDFKSTLLSFFSSSADIHALLSDPATLDWDTWFYAPGLPPKPAFDTSMVDACYALASRWAARSTDPSPFDPSPADISDWLSTQTVVFLETLDSLPTPLSPADARLLGDVYGLRSSRNVELSARYFGVALNAGETGVFGDVDALLGRVGRMKFVRPLYRKLKVVDEEFAREVFAKHRGFYHPICRKMVEADLGVS